MSTQLEYDIYHLKQDVAELKQDMAEIKKILTQLLGKQKIKINTNDDKDDELSVEMLSKVKSKSTDRLPIKLSKSDS